MKHVKEMKKNCWSTILVHGKVYVTVNVEVVVKLY